MSLAKRPAFGRLGGAVETSSSLLATATTAAAIVLGAVFVGCLLLQVFFRYVVNYPLSWTEEIAVFCFVWSMLLVASLGVREEFHVRLTFVVERLPDAGRSFIEWIIKVVVLLFGIYMVHGGAEMLNLIWGSRSAAIRYPIQYLYMSAPVSGALIAVHSLALLLRKPVS